MISSDGYFNPSDYETQARVLISFSRDALQKAYATARPMHFHFTDRLLVRHVLVVGATGSGKTNHAFHIIREALAGGGSRSCFIIDVKKEYRKLKGIVNAEVQVLAVGDEPRIRFNPLAPPDGVATDLWDRAFADVFTRAYGLSEPSRRILLDSLANLRDGAKVHPTLRELEKEVARFPSGSSKEQNSMRSLESRLHIINTGPVGRSLNADEPLDIGGMEKRVTIFEIGQVDSLRDQKFLAELVLAQIWHYDKARSVADENEEEEKLKRLVVIEEAHRYLSEERPPTQRGDRTLLELAIAEARRYGLGFLIIDQMPTLLSRYVWDNAGTVLAHRLTNLGSYQVVRDALGGQPLTEEMDDKRDPLALRLPEDLVLFRRYVHNESDSMRATGITIVPRVTAAQETEK